MEELSTSIAIPGSKELRGPGHTGTHDVSLGFSLFSLCVHGSHYFLVQHSLYSISHRIHFLLHVSSVALFGIVICLFLFPCFFYSHCLPRVPLSLFPSISTKLFSCHFPRFLPIFPLFFLFFFFNIVVVAYA